MGEEDEDVLFLSSTEHCRPGGHSATQIPNPGAFIDGQSQGAASKCFTQDLCELLQSDLCIDLASLWD